MVSLCMFFGQKDFIFWSAFFAKKKLVINKPHFQRELTDNQKMNIIPNQKYFATSYERSAKVSENAMCLCGQFLDRKWYQPHMLW